MLDHADWEVTTTDLVEPLQVGRLHLPRALPDLCVLAFVLGLVHLCKRLLNRLRESLLPVFPEASKVELSLLVFGRLNGLFFDEPDAFLGLALLARPGC